MEGGAGGFAAAPLPARGDPRSSAGGALGSPGPLGSPGVFRAVLHATANDTEKEATTETRMRRR
jgi:hypothetical protein